MDDRGASTVVGKSLEIGVVVLLIGVLSAALFGAAVPQYRGLAADRLADRALVSGAVTVESAVSEPTTLRRGRVRRTVALPETIAGEDYALEIDERSIVLVHPRDAIRRKHPLAVPIRVSSISGTIPSDAEEIIVEVIPTERGLRIQVDGRST